MLGRQPALEELEHSGVGSYLMPGSPLGFSGCERTPVRRAPVLGEHTEEVLAELLGLSDAEIGRLDQAGLASLGR